MATSIAMAPERRGFRAQVARAGGALTVVLGIYALAFVAWVSFGHESARVRDMIGDLAFLPVTILAAALAWSASRKQNLEPRTRRAWRVMSVAFLAFWLGDVLWAYFEVVRHTTPSPSVADIGYLAFYPLVFGALLSFPRARSKDGEQVKFALDATTVLLGGGMIIWYFVIRPTVIVAGSDALSTSLSLAYPVGDLVLIFGVGWAMLRRCEERSRLPLALLAAGLVLFVVADTGYGALSLKDKYQSGDWPDALWMVAQVLFVVAAHVQNCVSQRSEELAPEKQRPARFSLVPYVSVGAAYGLLLLVARPSVGTPLGGLVVGAIVLSGLVVGRQLLVQKENARLVHALMEMATVDELTGVMTRRHFYELADREFGRAQRYERSLCAIGIDVDQFKGVNDTFGHAVGDEVLRELGVRCRAAFRDTDLIARLGGDELMVLLPETPFDEGMQAAERLRLGMSEPIRTSCGALPVTLSIGVAEADGSTDLCTLLAHADAALYVAKEAGRNQARGFRSPATQAV